MSGVPLTDFSFNFVRFLQFILPVSLPQWPSAEVVAAHVIMRKLLLMASPLNAHGHRSLLPLTRVYNYFSPFSLLRSADEYLRKS